MQGDYAELIFEVKNISKTIRDIVKVRKELEKTSTSTKKLQDALISGWSFAKVAQSVKSFGDAFRDVQVTINSFSNVYGSFNKKADIGVKELMKDFEMTETAAKKLLNTVGSRTINLGLDSEKFTEINVELAKLSKNISAATGQNIDEVAKKLSQSLTGEVGGLKDLGIVINSSADSFKKAVDQLKNAGIGEEAAKAMVIWSDIKKQSNQFNGAFKNSTKSISNSFDNIKETLKTGVFSKAGEYLSMVFVPVLNKINDLLGNEIIVNLGGITLAIGSVVTSVLLLHKTLTSLTTLLTFTGILKSGGLVAGLAAKLSAAFASLLPVITTALTGLVAALTGALPFIIAAAVGAALGLALVKTVKLIREEGFAGAAKAIWEYFKGLSEKIVNFFKGKGFKTDETVNFEETTKKLEDNIKKLKEQLKLNIKGLVEMQADLAVEIAKEINGNKTTVNAAELYKNVEDFREIIKVKYDQFQKIDEVLDNNMYFVNRSFRKMLLYFNASQTDSGIETSPFKNLLKKNVDTFVKHFNNLLKAFPEIAKQINKKYYESKLDITKINSNTMSNLLNDKIFISSYYDFINEIMKQQKKRVLDQSINVKNFKEDRAFLQKLIDTQKADLKDWRTSKFDSIKDYMDSIERLSIPGQDTLKTKLANQAKKIKEFLSIFNTDKLFKETGEVAIDKSEIYSDKEKISLLKELRSLYIEKFELEMEGLEKERQYIEDTNNFIKESLSKVMTWSGKGVSAITEYSMEGYKFMTSGYRDLGNFSTMINQKNTQEIVLQQKTNSLIEDTKKLVSTISSKIDNLAGNSAPNISILN